MTLYESGKRILPIRLLLTAAITLAAFVVLKAQDIHSRISLDVRNERLGDVLNTISVQSHILFAYNPDKLPLDKRVSCKAINREAGDVLTELLKPLHIVWFVSEDQVILKADTPPADSGTGPSPARYGRYTLSGYIRDQASGEVLIGVNVYDQNTLRGTTTNAYGFYSITLPGGEYNLVFSLIGYTVQKRAVSLRNDATLAIELAETRIEMQAVEILSEKDLHVIDQNAAGEVHLSSSTLKRMAGFAGNVDVIKSLQAIPGINAFGDGSSFYYVRGGNSDQNLLLIDEAPIFNPAHLFGFFSALAPDAIKDVKAYKGDFPASFGGRLSSVIDIRARDGNFNRFGVSGNLGIFTSDFTVEGPLVKQKSSFIFSARRSNLNWLSTTEITGKSFDINFYDLNAKLNLRLNEKNHLFLTGFTGNDDFSRITDASVHTFGLSWNNKTASLRWNHLFNHRFFINTTGVYSDYNYYLYVSKEQNDYWHSEINNRTLKSDLTWYLSTSNTIRSGVEISHYHSDPGNVHFSDNETQKDAPEIPEYNALGISVYLSNNQLIRQKLAVNYGLRFSSWRDLGPASVYFFNAAYEVADTIQVAKGSYYSPYFNAEPRVSIAYSPARGKSLTAGYSRTVQYIQMLSNSTSPFTSLEVWAPSGPNIRPQKADQFSAGYLTQWAERGLNFSAEAFYKKLYHQIDYTDHANMLYNPLIEGELRFGEAKSYGIELLLRKTEGRFSGWIGYSYSRALKTIEGVNDGAGFPAVYDHPHSLFANLVLNAGNRWDIAAMWTYMSGSAFTSPVGFMQYNGYTVPIYGKKNNDRFPAYHRLDVSVTFRLNKAESRYHHNLVLSVYNLYGRSNPFSVNFNKIMNDNGDFVVPSDLDGSYEIIPTRISVAGIIPSLNYTFKF